jgi:hypothetical protein
MLRRVALVRTDVSEVLKSYVVSFCSESYLFSLMSYNLKIKMITIVFRDVTPCGSSKNRRFGGPQILLCVILFRIFSLLIKMMSIFFWDDTVSIL